MSSFDPALKADLTAAYDAALAAGIWAGTVLENSPDAYFNILAKIFFDPGQREEAATAGIQNRADLKIFDPLGFAVVDQVFRDALWPGSTDGEPTLGTPAGDPTEPQGAQEPSKPEVQKPAGDSAGKGLDTVLKEELADVYAGAVASGLWPGSDVIQSKEAYLAILGKIYFDASQRLEAAALGIETLADLQAYDPAGFTLLERIFGPRSDANGGMIGTDKPDKIEGKETDDVMVGLAGSDVMIGGKGKDVMDGGDGKDTAVIAAKQKDITVTVQKDAAVMVDDRTGAEGQDALHNIETLQFADGESLDLEALQNILTLAEGDLMRLVELYVAYFDRAPDAQGLFFWADCLAGGMSFAEIAGHFYDQPETHAKYGDGSDPALLVAQVYENCLGRIPDAAGLLFWTSKLDSGEVEPAGFILAVIDGAKAASGSAADADFFAAKASIGAYFAVQMGMTDNVVGQAVLSEFDGSADSLLRAREMVEDAYDLASGAEDGTLLIQLVGLIDDPFAGL